MPGRTVAMGITAYLQEDERPVLVVEWDPNQWHVANPGKRSARVLSRNHPDGDWLLSNKGTYLRDGKVLIHWKKGWGGWDEWLQEHLHDDPAVPRIK